MYVRRFFVQSWYGKYKDFGIWVKSGKFGRSAILFFHILINGIKYKSTNQSVKILLRRLIRSPLIWISTVCKCSPNLSEVKSYMNLPYLVQAFESRSPIKPLVCWSCIYFLFYYEQRASKISIKLCIIRKYHHHTLQTNPP